MPALLNSTSRRPNASLVLANRALIAAGSLTSVGTTRLLAPVDLPSFAVSSSLSFGTNRSSIGVATTAGATALTRIWCGASSMARLRVSACSPPLATEYADDGVAAMA